MQGSVLKVARYGFVHKRVHSLRVALYQLHTKSLYNNYACSISSTHIFLKTTNIVCLCIL